MSVTLVTGNNGPYQGPAGIVLTEAEARHVYRILSLYPRLDNADLRARLLSYIEAKDAERTIP